MQYHPEAAAGPHDAEYLFDQFVDLMAGEQVMPSVVPRAGRVVLPTARRAGRHRLRTLGPQLEGDR